MIAKLIFKLTLPALVIVTLDSAKIETSLTFIPVIVIIYGIVTSMIGFFVFKNEEKELRGSFLMVS